MIFIFFSFLLSLLVPDNKNEELIAKLERIAPSPAQITISNDLKIERKGGHLQGIQLYQHENETYIYMSGSSSRYGYLVTATTEKVEKLHILRKKPLKHAGGFQIHHNWLAVGIEDNELRNISEVHVYQLGDPKSDQLLLKGLVERKGAWERATAGAVAIIEYDNHLLMLVGDWSNRHIDFYNADLTREGKLLEFEKTCEIEMASYSKEKWIDDVSWPYQNINLVNYQGQLLLFGFSSGEGDTNLMDVYQLQNPLSDTPEITKIFTKSYPKTSLTRFGWGAGVYFDGSDFTLYACGENVRKQVFIQPYTEQ